MMVTFSFFILDMLTERGADTILITKVKGMVMMTLSDRVWFAKSTRTVMTELMVRLLIRVLGVLVRKFFDARRVFLRACRFCNHSFAGASPFLHCAYC